MNVVFSLVAVLVLCLLAIFGVHSAGLHFLFGVVIPYVAFCIFIFGMIYRVLKWAKSPVPFRIPTTCGQQRHAFRFKGKPSFKQSKLDNPATKLQVLARVALEVLFFRSLLRNTRTELTKDKKIVFGPNKWLWLGGLAFHWTMLIVVIRHLRFFTEPVPRLIVWLQNLDGFLQVGVPGVYITSLLFVAAVTYLFIRRVLSPQLRYISLASDYFPLFLLLGIGVTGILLRHFIKTDIVGVKELTLGLLSFSPAVPEGLHTLFYIHFFFVCSLFAYFPFSKLVHFTGVFLSPTRNMANNNRMLRHVNPWNYPVKVHTYEEYEDD
ncbi:MAG: sulfate reduction electron transfer complex DsrMKJOP subunit DsrM, partial [Pseudomonadota bacterium]